MPWRCGWHGGWPYSQPPHVPFELNRDSPQATALEAWWPVIGSRGAAVLRDYVAGWFDGTLDLAYVSWVNTHCGPALRTDNNVAVLGRTNLGDVDVSGDLTVMARLIPRRQETVRDTAAVSKWNTGGSPGTNEWLLGLNYYATPTDYYPFLMIEIGSTTHSVAHTTQWNIGEELFLAGVRRGTALYIYRSLGNALVSNSAACGSGAINNIAGRVVRLGEIAGTAVVNTNADYLEVGIWPRGLSEAEIYRLFSQQWDLYRPLRRYWAVGVEVAAIFPPVPGQIHRYHRFPHVRM